MIKVTTEIHTTEIHTTEIFTTSSPNSPLDDIPLNNTYPNPYPNPYPNYPNPYSNPHQYYSTEVMVVESLAIYKVPERLKKRWGYIHVPKESNYLTKLEQKRWGFIAPMVGIPSNFPVFDSNPSPVKPRFYHYI